MTGAAPAELVVPSTPPLLDGWTRRDRALTGAVPITGLTAGVPIRFARAHGPEEGPYTVGHARAVAVAVDKTENPEPHAP